MVFGSADIARRGRPKRATPGSAPTILGMSQDMKTNELRSNKEYDIGEEYGEQPWQSEELLYQLHVKEGLSQTQISEILGCACNTISKWAGRHGIVPPHRDKETLKELYQEQWLSAYEIAEELGVSYDAIYNNLERHDIERDPSEDPRKPWRHKETLDYLYWGKGKTTEQVAERLGCGRGAVFRWMDYHDMPRRSVSEATSRALSNPVAGYYVDYDGYMRWYAADPETGKGYNVLVHRLLAASEFGLDAIKGKHIHHKNGVKWDNRPDNIEPLTPSEHRVAHSKSSCSGGEA